MPLGESLVWSVSFRGMPVGTAELDVLGEEGAVRVESRFETVGLAEQFRPQRHRLVTSLDRQPSASEDVHSALGRVRAWAVIGANPSTLNVRYGARTYLVKFAQPYSDNSLAKPSLRIEAQARSMGELIDMTLWLSADEDRLPLQMTLSQDGKQVKAELVQSK